MTSTKNFFIFAVMLLIFTPLVIAAVNDPGHDTLYIQKTGDNISGFYNFSGALHVLSPSVGSQAANKNYVDAAAGSGLSGTGAGNRMAFWNSATALSYSDNFTVNTTLGFLAIGTTNATDTLVINGTIRTYNRTSTVGIYQDELANIGIGTLAPTQKLTVSGALNVTGVAIFGNSICSAGQVLSTTATGQLACVTDAGGGSAAAGWANTSTTTYTALNVNLSIGNLTIANGRLGVGIENLTDTIVLNGTIKTLNSTGTIGLYQDANGNLGVGTLAPTQKLTVSGTFNATGAAIFENSICTTGQVLSTTSTGQLTCITGTSSSSAGGWTNTTATTATTLSVNLSIGNLTIPNGRLGVGIDNLSEVIVLNGTIRTINSTGTIGIYQDNLANIGIGTIDPKQKLNVLGTANITGAFYLANSICSAGQLLTTNTAGQVICTNAASSSSAGGWTNTSTMTSTALHVNITTGNLTVINGALGLRYEYPAEVLVVNGTIRTLNSTGSLGLYQDNNARIAIGTTVANQSLEIAGGLRLNTSTAKPNCAIGQRGTFWMEQSTSGTDDYLYACMRNSSDSYNWILVARGG